MKFTDIYLDNQEACKDAICHVLGLPVPKVRLNRTVADTSRFTGRVGISQGVITLRTATMSRAQADSFAKCLTANPRFAGVHVEETTIGSGKWRVAYLPIATTSQEAVFLAYQKEQCDRAEQEMHQYGFDRTGPTGWRVTSAPKRGGSRSEYQLDARVTTCSCPHFVGRLSGTGALCKHLVALYALVPEACACLASSPQPLSDKQREADFG